MKLREWLIGQYGVNLDTSGDMSGVDIVDTLCKCLCDAGFSFNDQISVLLQAPDYYCNDDFLGACVDRVKLIRHRLDELEMLASTIWLSVLAVSQKDRFVRLPPRWLDCVL